MRRLNNKRRAFLGFDMGCFRRQAIREKLYRADPHCHYCGRLIQRQSDATLDHKTPRIKGGTDHEDNLVISCQACNSDKDAKPYETYVALALQRRQRRVRGGRKEIRP